MEAKIRIGTKRVISVTKSLKSSLDKNNTRLVSKYVSQLTDSLESLDQELVSAQVEGVSADEPYLVESNQVSDQANELIIQADEFLLETEENEEAIALQKVTTVKLNDLISSLTVFNDSLSTTVEKILNDVDESKHQGTVDNLISIRRKQLESYQCQKVSLESQVTEDHSVAVEKLKSIYIETYRSLDRWIETALKFCAKGIKDENLQPNPKKASSKGPGLKLDRLALPVFKGNVRAFARFVREFESTVGLEFSDPKIQVMYLQNQCLIGPPKDLVRNLITYDEVMGRLKERYGKPSVVIDTVLKDIGDLRLKSEDPGAVIVMSRCLQMAWDDMVAIGTLDEFCNIITLRTLEGKLPQRLQMLWAQEKNDNKYESSKQSMIALKDFIENHRKIAEEVIAMRGKNTNTCESNLNRSKFDETKINKHVGSVSLTEQKKIGCFRCGFNHRVKDCTVPPSIKCRRCHRQGHIQNACREPPPQQDPNGSEKKPFAGNTNTERDNQVRLPIETLNTSEGSCLVLWDSGSMLNLVSQNWITKTALEGKECELEFKVVDSGVKTIRTKLYDIPLLSRGGDVKIIKAYAIESLAAHAITVDTELVNKVCSNASVHIGQVDNSSGTIELLLGSGCAGIFPETEYVHEELCLMTSNYGQKKFFIAGQQSSPEKYDAGSVSNVQYVKVTPLHDVCSAVVAQMNDINTDFMSVEDLGIRPPPICKSCKSCETCKPASQFLSLKEYRELNVIKSKLSYDEHAKVWTASYPYLRDPFVLKDNYDIALKVLIKRENKLMKDGILMEKYKEQIEDFVNRKVIRKMSESEIENWDGPVRYVDHREVFKEGSTTPVRIVINSSFHVGREFSLNDILMKGPNVLTNLLEILIRWRLHPVGFVADIAKMYHNVKTGKLEANLRRLLWRNYEQDRSPDVYCFEVVTFGDRPAGCIVVSALKATADMFSSISEKGAQVLKQDSYMDDIASGDHTLKDSKELASKIEEIALQGGFKFKKFIFAGEFGESGEEMPMEKVLGLNWNPSWDTINLKVNLNHNKRTRGQRPESIELNQIPFSRRICLRIVNGIFDPLGIFTAVTVKLKILMKLQFVLNDKYKKWDTRLEKKDSDEWIKALQDIVKLNSLPIPRNPLNAPYPFVSKNGKFILICFTDASEEAMCAVVYIRFESSSGEVDIGLITSKTKVTPAKKATMPKLELSASLLGARLVNKVCSSISVKNNPKVDTGFESKYIFMDSKIALGTLNKGHLSNDFSGNCAAEIRGKTEGFIFGWVASEHNIADLGSRGAAPTQVDKNSEWQKGPTWLYAPVEEWPMEVYPLVELPSVNNIEKVESVIDIEKFSSLHNLHKHTALCLKFARSRGNGKPALDCNWKKIVLSPDDYREAEKFWVKKVSESVLKLYEKGKLQSLRPSTNWDDSGNYRKVITSGRLGELLKIGYDVDELTVLDPSHTYTKLVLKDLHDVDHGGDDRVVWKSREKYWIPQARRIVKGIRNRCYRCKLLNKRNAQQMMAPLPSTRVLPTPAWTYTSIDLFGPIEHVDMVRKRLKEKCWGVVFTCMVSRAVHLDLTQAYHTDALLQAIRRFMALRGAPKEFLSDQGSQMIACSKELAGIFELIDWNVIKGWCAKHTIAWKLVPPQAQHMNGVTEALIRSTKNILKQTLDGKRLNYAETQTVLHEAAQVMNCRPLGNYSRPGSDPLDGGPITPNHLLLGRATSRIPDLQFTNVSNVKRMKFLQNCTEEFWNKWRVVVFHSLVPQYKWHRKHRNVQVNDVVLLNDDTALVGEYKLGQVHSIKTSKDGLVRCAQVRCVTRKDENVSISYLDRPVHKLCVIVPVEEQEQ